MALSPSPRSSVSAAIVLSLIALLLGACGSGTKKTDGGVLSDADGTSTGGDGGCAPITCSQAGKDCGRIPDGCGGLLECGSCQSPLTCGGGGTPNVCGHGTCTTTTCEKEGKNCGTISDGCGDVLDCGSCQSPQTCGGGGIPNVCGHGTCTPTTCEKEGKDCDTISDNCGGMLSCGTCQSPLTCGGGGVQNVCGASCDLGCPSGYTCNTVGICAGGTPTGLKLDVKTHKVAGVVTMNGKIPLSQCSSSNRAYVHFDEPTLNYHFSIAVPCNGATSPFTFDGLVYPGTYKVSIKGYSSELPSQLYVVANALTIQADTTNLKYDVKTHKVAGVVTMNGKIPLSQCSSSNRAYVHFDEPTLNYHFSIVVPCNGATSPFTFEGYVYPGTYKVSVKGYSSELPSQLYVVIQLIEIP